MRACVYLHMHVCMSVFVSVCSLHLTRAHILDDGKIASGRSPEQHPSGLELGRTLARHPFWLFLGQAPGCLDILQTLPNPGAFCFMSFLNLGQFSVLESFRARYSVFSTLHDQKGAIMGEAPSHLFQL